MFTFFANYNNLYFNQNEEEDLELVLKVAKTQLSSVQSKTKEKFLHCLFMCHQHFPDIAVHYASSFVYNLPQIQRGVALTQCISMLEGALPYFKANVESGGDWKKELGMVNIRQYLTAKAGCNSDTQQAALKVMGKAVKLFHLECPELTQEFMGDLQDLTSHTEVSIRQDVYSIVQWLFLAKVDGAKELLLQGLTDPDPTMVKLTTNFLEDNHINPKTGSNTVPRLELIVTDLLAENSEDAFLNICSDLALRLAEKSPEFTRKIYPDPLGQCVFQEQQIDTSWRSQFDSGVLAPMYTETLGSSQSQNSQSQHQQMQIRATQNTLAFAPTQAQNVDADVSRSQTSFLSSMTSSTQITSTGYDVGQFRVSPQDVTFGQQQQQLSNQPSHHEHGLTGLVRIGKRFGKQDHESHEQTKVRFAKQHQKKLTQSERLEKERKGRRHAQVSLLRSYRSGDLPDIQITFADVIKPLKALCSRDNIIARQVVTSIVTSVIQDSDSEATTKQLKREWINILCKTRNINNKNVVTAALEIGIAYTSSKDLENIDSQSLVTLTRALNLEPLALLLMERKPPVAGEPVAKRRKVVCESKYATEDVLAMVDLYKSIGDHSSARGLYIQEVSDAKDLALNAMTSEAMGHLIDAKNMYKSLCDADKESNLSSINKKLWTESYFNVMEKLSSWGEMGYEISKMSPQPSDLFDSDWKQEFLLPKYINSGLHLLVEPLINPSKEMENSLNCNQLYDAVKEWLEDKTPTGKSIWKVLQKDYPFNLSQVFLLKKKMKESTFWKQRALKCLLDKWSTLNYLNMNSLSNLLQDMQRVSNSLSPDTWSLEDLNRQVMGSTCTIQAGDQLTMDWRFYQEQKKSKTSAGPLLAKAYLGLTNKSLEMQSYEMAIRFLSLAAKASQSVDQDTKNLFVEHKYKASILKCISQYRELPDKRFPALYRQLMSIENEGKLPKKQKVLLQASALQNLSTAVREIQPSREVGICDFYSNLFDKAEKVEHFKNLLIHNGRVSKFFEQFLFRNILVFQKVFETLD